MNEKKIKELTKKYKTMLLQEGCSITEAASALMCILPTLFAAMNVSWERFCEIMGAIKEHKELKDEYEKALKFVTQSLDPHQPP